ncbi:MAG: hypothetical protein ACE5I2_11185 [Anaerolineae bacterium]
MSTKIQLYFKKYALPHYEDLGIFAIRLLCDVTFKASKLGYTEVYPAIVDTGAPISLIPMRIWQQCEVRRIRDSVIRGVVPHEECSLPVTLAEVTCRLLDQEGQTNDLMIKAHLASTNAVPLIIGFRDLLEHMNLYANCRQGAAYLQCE